MKKFGRATISDVLECAKKEFVNDHEALYFVHFDYRGRLVIAYFEPVPDDIGWYVSSFKVVYSRSVLTYTLGDDYTWYDAVFSD